ncbi:MAG TPA: hypothetical protein DEQ20_01565 [Desulfobulbaceae bacterium]|nr:MAG: hypothetical protein A2520_04200 [Deltaproteobacteria bacterium RIFOXYD12_FULL_53_23]HCC53605.1 hypothetical protein [Desulfobulbaceae bacterium]
MGLFCKQLLYLSNDQVTIFQWEKGLYSTGHIFFNDEAGWEDFSCYLAQYSDTPTFLLADLIEESFQQDTIPHVLGSARQALIQRRLGQLYRDTPYRHAIQQGREVQGRKDDRMLFSALVNMELLKPWVNALLQQKMPLAGIYSPALLSIHLIGKLGLGSENLLLVTHQSNGLRQSFFQNSELKFSRLTSLNDHKPDTVAEMAARETANTQHFLASTRLLPRDATLEVIILAGAEYMPHFQSFCQDTPAITYRLLSLTDAATQLGLKNPGSFSICDLLFLSLLNHSSTNHYAPKEQTRYFRLRHIRIGLNILSLCLVTGVLLWTGINGLKTMQHSQQSRQMVIEARNAHQAQEAVVRLLPATDASPQSMKAAVNIEQIIAHNALAPKQLLSIVSQALDALPQISLDQLRWQVSTGDKESPTMPQAAVGLEAAPDAMLIGIPKKINTVLLIEGEVKPFAFDYRSALESVRALVAELGKNKQLKVEIIRFPLDIAPTSTLTGKTGNEAPDSKAQFSLKLTLSPEN